ncbi:hypothetical protein FHS61_000682 [Altererythrobacter atlanticus]|uniref:Uncharacterized protein n=1 Tax=Croceibacterium atlanticum TaxID=1267766 RepID=A0A0F7KTL7_9SPHN|nr:Zn-ribbon domain-containing OB-fold protein [Croceibacterium atlanticum]AKH42909.1 hypothetical protein WYH_01873 [Croceibacterium atlanticum]MBB5731689.1 hypothetical protein [Croceibacterium atlanticum]
MPGRNFAPIENPDTEGFWQGCRDGTLLIQRCKSCGTSRHPPSPLCHSCHSAEREWVRSDGNGEVWSFSVLREPLGGWGGPLPAVVAIIELEEGVKMVSNLVGVEPEAVGIGMKVKVCFENGDGEIALPRFRPAI